MKDEQNNSQWALARHAKTRIERNKERERKKETNKQRHKERKEGSTIG